MSRLVVGLSHHSAPVDVLERVATPCRDGDKVLHQLLDRDLMGGIGPLSGPGR